MVKKKQGAEALHARLTPPRCERNWLNDMEFYNRVTASTNINYPNTRPASPPRVNNNIVVC